MISAVREIHPEYDTIEPHIPKIYNFLKQFNTVISLNYDLILYWVMMYGNNIQDGHKFKDCFINSSFDDDWNKFRTPIKGEESCTLVFYPHGNLMLATNQDEEEKKLPSNGKSLLNTILQSWDQYNIPLFVSEGTTEQKKKSIKKSYYLSTIYREVLPSIKGNLVIYGWSMGEQDLHILEKLCESSISSVAVSVYKKDGDYCHRVSPLLREKLNKKIDKIDFFCSKISECI